MEKVNVVFIKFNDYIILHHSFPSLDMKAVPPLLVFLLGYKHIMKSFITYMKFNYKVKSLCYVGISSDLKYLLPKGEESLIGLKE